jgi:hypothetical protein
MIRRLVILILFSAASASAQNNFNVVAPGGKTSNADESMPSSEERPEPPASNTPETKYNDKGYVTLAGVRVLIPAEFLQYMGGSEAAEHLLKSRFLKYLTTPPAELKSQSEHNAIVRKMMNLLSAGKIGARNLDAAFRLLPQAAEFQEDASVCDAIANQVLGAWQAQQQVARLAAANQALEADRKRHEWNTRMATQSSGLDTPPKDAAAAAVWAKERETARAGRLQPHSQRLAEVNALLNANRAKSELSAMESRVEFQTLMVQLLLQRRFQHVIISTRFYRSIFDDGDNRLRLSKETLDRLSSTGGGDSPGPSSFFPLIGGLLMDLPPTVTSLELLANEFIKDAGQGVESAGFLLRKDELKGATHRLAESFVLGEHLPALQQFPHEDRQRIYEFARRGDELTTAIEVKDYLRAEALARQMQEMAKDFDPTEALTAVQTFRNVSRMHLARARNAALGGDAGTLERELRAATEIWPNNPDLADVSGQIFQQTDLQQQALSELQRLIEQGDHRAIFRQNAKFIAATALYPEWQEKLGTILEAMTEIEGSLQRAREIQQRGDAAGAWESIQLASVKYPEDNEINRLRADLASGGAATFVQSLNKGGDHEARGEYGAALAWYLDAHRQYPPSKFAQEKISALAERILPGASPAAP